uniref:Uncharacterized protein n=1 Tax=Ciona intestinalis TaxID=7719 RepID=F7A178_CIOIN
MALSAQKLRRRSVKLESIIKILYNEIDDPPISTHMRKTVYTLVI